MGLRLKKGCSDSAISNAVIPTDHTSAYRRWAISVLVKSRQRTHLLVVALTGDDLRRHPEGRSDLRLALLAVLDSGGDALMEISTPPRNCEKAHQSHTT